jgi:hypothetical protein
MTSNGMGLTSVYTRDDELREAFALFHATPARFSNTGQRDTIAREEDVEDPLSEALSQLQLGTGLEEQNEFEGIASSSFPYLNTTSDSSTIPPRLLIPTYEGRTILSRQSVRSYPLMKCGLPC